MLANAILVVLISFWITSSYNIKLVLIFSKSFYISFTFPDILLGTKIIRLVARVVRSKEGEGPEVVIGWEFSSFFAGNTKRTRSGF